VVGLAEPVLAGEIDIAELARAGLALVVPLELGVMEIGHARIRMQGGAL
jgi:hypothetical protein